MYIFFGGGGRNIIFLFSFFSLKVQKDRGGFRVCCLTTQTPSPGRVVPTIKVDTTVDTERRDGRFNTDQRPSRVHSLYTTTLTIVYATSPCTRNCTYKKWPENALGPLRGGLGVHSKPARTRLVSTSTPHRSLLRMPVHCCIQRR